MKKAARAPRTDGEATRARILEAAGELFAAHGYAEASNKAIAAQAEVDLASINYHFGSRSGLYQAVLTEAHRRLVDVADLQKLAQSPMAAADKLQAVMAHLVQSALSGSENWHISVLTAEILAPSSHIQVLFQSEIPRKAALVVAIMSEITGIPQDDPAMQRCLLSVMAPCLLLQIGRRGIPGPAQAVLQMPADVLVNHLSQFAIAGLRAIGQEYADAAPARGVKSGTPRARRTSRR